LQTPRLGFVNQRGRAKGQEGGKDSHEWRKVPPGGERKEEEREGKGGGDGKERQKEGKEEKKLEGKKPSKGGSYGE